MNCIDELVNTIDTMADMIEFSYNGKDGDIEAWHNKDTESLEYRLTYNGILSTADSIEDLIAIPCIDGKTLAEIASEIEIV